MAEALLRAALPATSGWRAASAGLAACEGARASDEAVAALDELDCDLRGHRSRRVTPEQVRCADAIVAMTGAHAQQLAAQFPDARDRVYLLCSFDPSAPAPRDVADPFCGSLDDYRRCRDFIRRAIPGLVRFLEQTASSGC
jgi:protein-tyrosine-phosphatase